MQGSAIIILVIALKAELFIQLTLLQVLGVEILDKDIFSLIFDFLLLISIEFIYSFIEANK
jgi:hypothetical protein